VSDGPEIFDDLYLGLQAGGALRKQRRGEELTEQEREALGRWQQMAMWRKAVAVGAFALGTFGLGFTIGGLVFALAGRIPARGERVHHPSGIEFEVLEADPRRIKRLRIHMPQAPQTAKVESKA